MTVAAVKHVTDERVLQADVRVMPRVGDDGGTAELRQVILYHKQKNINSVIAEHRISFTDDAGELSSCDDCVSLESHCKGSSVPSIRW